jgi:hypothetical protein
MSLTSELRSSVSHYKLARKIVEQVCEANKLEVAAVWSTVSNREFDYFDRFFRREKRRTDPLSSVKKPRTAFSFFTQQNRNEIQAKHPNLTFGAVSKLVGEQWRGLDEKSRAKYVALENEDKSRYNTARQQVIDDMATRVADTPAVAAPAATEAAAPAPKAARKASTKAPKAAATPAATEAVAAPVAAAAAPAKAAKTKSAKAAAAPAAPAAEAAAPVAAAAPAKAAKAKSAAPAAAKKQ